MSSYTSPKLLLVQLYSELQPPDAEPYAVDILAQAARAKAGDWIISTITCDERSDRPFNNVVNEIRQFNPKVLGISVPQGTYGSAIRLLNEVSQYQQRPSLIVLGHAIPTYAPEAFLNQFPDIVIVRGWGEEALVSLLRLVSDTTKALDPAILIRVPSVCFMSESGITSTQSAPSSIPVLLQRTPGRFLRRIEASRGCHYGLCTFCTRPPGPRNAWERIDIAAFKAALNQLQKDDVSFFTFADEDFIGSDLSGAGEIADILCENGTFTFSISVRADNVCGPKLSPAENQLRAELFAKLVRGGLRFVFLGLESLSDSQLTRFGKGIRVSDSLNAMAVLHNLGISIELGFMLFDPFVTKQELRDNARSLRHSGAWRHVSNIFSKLRIQRGTALEALSRKHGLLKDFNIELIDYDWKFASSDSARICAAGEAWNAAFHPALRLIRNAFRQFPEDASLYDFLCSIRELDLRALELLCAQEELDDMERALTPLIDMRTKYWVHFIPALAAKYGVDQEDLLSWLEPHHNGS